MGTFIKNDFLYWGYDITPAKIIVRQSQLIFDYVLDIIFLALGAGGILSLGWWLWQHAVASNYKIYLGALISFWGVKNNLILYFWIGLAFLLFYFYRRARRREKHLAVKLLTYRQKEWLKKQPQIIPNNWRELRFFKTKIDVSLCFRYELLQLIEKAYVTARQMRHQELKPAHILLAAISEYSDRKKDLELKRISAIFARLGVYRGKIGPKIEQALQKAPAVANNGAGIIPIISKELKQSLIEAYVQAQNNKHYYIEMADLLNPLIEESPTLQEIFKELNVSPEQIANSTQWLLVNDRFASRQRQSLNHKKRTLQQRLERATSAVATPLLNHFCVDLTQEALGDKIPVFINREAETAELFKLMTEKRQPIILTGKPGVGKWSLINYLAERVITDEAPRALTNRRLLELDLNKVKNEGGGLNLEQKIFAILLELNNSNVILAVKNITDEVWEIIKKYPGKFYLLATADKKLAGAANIELFEPTGGALTRILASGAARLEQEYKVIFSYQSLEVIASAGKNYPDQEALPARAISWLEKIARGSVNAPDRNITADTAAKAIAGEVGAPYTKILKEII